MEEESNEDGGRSDQLGLALVLSERLGAKPKPARSETPHTRPNPYTPYQQHQPDQTVLSQSPAPLRCGVTERASFILPVMGCSIIATCIDHCSCCPNKQSHLFSRTPRRLTTRMKKRGDSTTRNHARALCLHGSHTEAGQWLQHLAQFLTPQTRAAPETKIPDSPTTSLLAAGARSA
jgi:hypothetical protein